MESQWLGAGQLPPNFKKQPPLRVPDVEDAEKIAERKMERDMQVLAVAHDSPFLEKYVFPDTEERIRHRLKAATSSQELWQAQGMLILLDEIKETIKAAKTPKKVNVDGRTSPTRRLSSTSS